MAKVNVITKAVIDGNPVGSAIQIDEKDFARFESIGYVVKDESKKTTTRTRKKSTPKKVEENKDEKK
ncbi:hypothetical protein [Abyssicoccus albus]|uniref:Uncharacterized protein n=1 Tax=Abyssicoccus albus TaxID=1817405 RepID=A0A3N5BY64_9BACL|nr:hypothetical protein [Abyssicoccus albus]RPF54738.1 hypothetical protein EDD62_1698 [Abyssicoccus albus]